MKAKYIKIGIAAAVLLAIVVCSPILMRKISDANHKKQLEQVRAEACKYIENSEYINVLFDTKQGATTTYRDLKTQSMDEFIAAVYFFDPQCDKHFCILSFGVFNQMKESYSAGTNGVSYSQQRYYSFDRSKDFRRLFRAKINLSDGDGTKEKPYVILDHVLKHDKMVELSEEEYLTGVMKYHVPYLKEYLPENLRNR